MKVIAKGNFWSNGIEGFPGKVLSNEEQDSIGEVLLDQLLKNKLIEIIDQDPFLENLDSPDPLELTPVEEKEAPPAQPKKKKK